MSHWTQPDWTRPVTDWTRVDHDHRWVKDFGDRYRCETCGKESK